MKDLVAELRSAAVVAGSGARRIVPVLREDPCECGEMPMLNADRAHYICTNPACDGYGQICSEA